LLIQKHRPIWIQEIQGFGNHDPGAGRYVDSQVFRISTTAS
jgi:hypothetical protein